jgi:hypothetical protein
MKEYISNILPRIANFSQSLDKKELLVDQPWTAIDEQSFHQYIFKRDGKLIISVNSNVQIGSWEYISPAESLLIVTDDNKTLLKLSFFNNAVLILQRPGNSEEPWILLNHESFP